jgi:16S rRNA (uracil1498-N3)-methyltransferase
MEWFVEKATEIGIHEITPIICDNSERKFFKTDRAHKIIQSAMKQSNQFYLPIINEPISFSQFIKSSLNETRFIAHCEDDLKNEFFNEIPLHADICILIGPEGDFSKKEITLAIENDFKPVALGKTRLRTETAALVATQTIVLKNTI